MNVEFEVHEAICELHAGLTVEAFDRLKRLFDHLKEQPRKVEKD